MEHSRPEKSRRLRRAALCALATGAVVAMVLVQTSPSSSTDRARPSSPKPDHPSETVAASAAPAPVHQTVDLFGDSLGYQAQPYLDMFVAESGNDTVSNNTFGGTATCDWLGDMATAAAVHPRAAVLVFSGNAFTTCMDGVAPRSPQYYDRYTSDTARAIGIFASVGAHVFLVGTPIDASSAPGWDHLDDIYRQLAQANPHTVSYVDAGAAVESPSGGFTWQLPCSRIEPSCGASGTNIVRSPDGVHFCPDGTPAKGGVTGPCDEYSPGAFRFALAIAEAVTQYQARVPVARGSLVRMV